MRKSSGYTFLELIIVVGLLGVVASAAMMSSRDTSKTYSLLAEAESAASRISLVVAEAQSSQSSIKLICDSKSLSAQYFRSPTASNAVSNNELTSNVLYPSGLVGKGVVSATSGTASKTVPIIDYYTITSQNKTLVLSCNSACSGGNVYITSDGSILNTNTCASGNPLELIFYSTQNTNIQSKVAFSAVGYPRIYLQDISITSVPNEIIN
jgi:prepilin-type N-terminal cleavage/methylation domain-containing protein